MKTKNTISYIWLMTLALTLMLLFSGCGKKEADKYGQEISNKSERQQQLKERYRFVITNR